MTRSPTNQAQPASSSPSARGGRASGLVARITRATATAALLVLAAGCGSIPLVSGPATTDQPGAAQAGGSPQAAEVPGQVDACRLLTNDEVAEVIGRDAEVVPQPYLAAGGCIWRNPAQGGSVTLVLYDPGSARFGLPDEEEDRRPGPDGIQFVSYGQTQFLAKDRFGELHFITDLDSDVLDGISVKLVHAIRGRL